MFLNRIRITKSVNLVRALITTGIILLITSCVLIYFVMYEGTQTDSETPGSKVVDGDKGPSKKPEIENYHEKWKNDARVINIGKPQRRMMYFGTHSIEKENRSIERVVFTFHGLGRNAAASYEYTRGYYDGIEKTAIFAPSYTGKSWQKYKFRKIIRWDNNWPLGVRPKKEFETEISPNVGIDSFNVIDFLVYKALKSFPSVHEIAFVGFSAGSQLLQRYMASSPYVYNLWNRGFYVNGYLISPGDYMYLNHFRANNMYKDSCYKAKSLGDCLELARTRPDFWVVPQNNCNQLYNVYKYGLEGLNSDVPYVLRKDSVEVILSGAYLEYPIYYFVGGRDKNPPRSKTCSAMLQGITRIQRMILFYTHIKSLDHTAPHVAVIISGCQHNEHCIGTNPQTKKHFSPAPLTKPDRSGNLNPFFLSKNPTKKLNLIDNNDDLDNDDSVDGSSTGSSTNEPLGTANIIPSYEDLNNLMIGHTKNTSTLHKKPDTVQILHQAA